MDDDKKFNMFVLRGWQRSQLELLKQFAISPLVSQTKLSHVSGSPVRSHQLGGKITPLTRANLILKAGKDDKGQCWQLNEEKIERKTLLDFLESMGI